MAEINESISEIVERTPESRLNSIVALLVAISATFMALCNVKDGNIVQGMQQAQAGAVDEWSYYQAKGMKQNLAESTIDQLTIQRQLVTDPKYQALLDRKIDEYVGHARKYETEKADIKKKAEDLQKQYDALNVHDDQFDMSDACLSVALALFGVTALTQKRWLLALALAFMAFGVLMGVAGFANWSLHPDFMAGWLS